MATLNFNSLIPQQQGSLAPQSAIDFSSITPTYKSAIWPLSANAAGQTQLDWSAGIPGMAQRLFQQGTQAVMAPGRAAFSGSWATQPGLATPYSGMSVGGTVNPQGGATTDTTEANNLASTTAQLFSPASAAMRAGEIIPGEMAKTIRPSAEQLVDVANKGYSAVRDSGLEINGDSIGNLVTGIKSNLLGTRGIVDELAPKTFQYLSRLDNPPEGSVVTFPYLDAIRRGLGQIRLGTDKTDALAAGDALHAFDNFMSTVSPANASTAASRAATSQANVGRLPVPLGSAAGTGADALSPQDVARVWQTARGNYAAAMRSNDITGALDKANTGIEDQALARAAATHSGRNLDNNIRQRLATYRQDPQAMGALTQPEIDAIDQGIEGGTLQNQMRLWGNRLGGGQGMHGGLMGVVGAATGEAMHPGIGAAIGAAAPIVAGTALKAGENALSLRNLRGIDELLRQRSPLYQSMQQQGGLTPRFVNPLLPGLTPSAMPMGLLPGYSQPPQPITPDQLRLLQAGGA